MIAWIFIVVGAFLALGGAIGLLSMLVLPVKERIRIVCKGEYDLIRARTNAEVGKHVRNEKKHLMRDCICAVIIGIMMFFAGIYLGYAAEGEGFWFYKQFYPEETTNQVWDEINEDGQFVAADGKAYTYYILISGQDVIFRGEQCVDLSDLKSKLSLIRRENTVIIIDYFAVSSTYHSVKDMLNELGIEYEETN